MIADNSVEVTSVVLAPGPGAGRFTALYLTSNTQVPIGQPQTFPTATAVSNYFGASSAEASAATIFFGGVVNNLVAPSQLSFAQFPTGSVAGYLRGGRITTTEIVQAGTGVLTIVVDGVSKTSSSINLSVATSGSNAATIIQGATWTPALGATVTFDAIAQAIKFTSVTTGATSAVSYATGTLSAGLKLTQATGAVISAGAVLSPPSAYMTTLTATFKNFVPFSTMFEPSTLDKLSFAGWNSAQQNRYIYAPWNTDATAINTGDTTSFVPQAIAASTQACFPIYGTVNYAAFAMAYFCTLDFTQSGGLPTAKFRQPVGLAAYVTDEAQANNLTNNKYNYVGAFAAGFGGSTTVELREGTALGAFPFADALAGGVYLRLSLQAAQKSALLNTPAIPFNPAGYATINAVISGVMEQGKVSGAVTVGVTLDALQRQSILSQTGNASAANAVESTGYYVDVRDPGAASRQARRLPGKVFYAFGGAVHFIDLAAIAVI